MSFSPFRTMQAAYVAGREGQTKQGLRGARRARRVLPPQVAGRQAQTLLGLASAPSFLKQNSAFAPVPGRVLAPDKCS